MCDNLHTLPNERVHNDCYSGGSYLDKPEKINMIAGVLILVKK